MQQKFSLKNTVSKNMKFMASLLSCCQYRPLRILYKICCVSFCLGLPLNINYFFYYYYLSDLSKRLGGTKRHSLCEGLMVRSLKFSSMSFVIIIPLCWEFFAYNYSLETTCKICSGL